MKYFTYTDIGPRAVNEDSFYAVIKNGELYACVADGVGGIGLGDFASQFVTKLFVENIDNFKVAPLICSNTINSKLAEYTNNKFENKNAATTFTAAIINLNSLNGVHVGDSRICILRGNGIKQITEEHNEAGRLVREGKLSVADKKFYPRKNIVEHIMGNLNLYSPQSIYFELEPFDRIIFSTDGFHDVITKKEIRDISINNKSFDQFNKQLVVEVENRMLKDNTTFISIEVS